MWKIVFLLVTAAAFTSATWSGCGGSCGSNVDCDDVLCSFCDPIQAVCISGHSCNISCSADSDCEQLRYCSQCTNGKCGPGPHISQQCGVCTDDANCTKNTYCTKCMPQRGGASVCAAPCFPVGACTMDYDCGIASKCSDCLQSKCSKGAQCAATCATSSDCDQSGLCHTCVDFTCSAVCSQRCEQDTDCNGPVTGCGVCAAGLCSQGVTCGSRCNYDRDCSGSSCTTCRQNTCQNSTPAAVCGTTCARNIDCLFAGSCTSCTAGTCTPPMCGSECERPEDCSGTTNCSSCFNGQCALPTCGAVCFGDGDCSAPWPGSRYCGYCLDNRCSTNAPSAQCGLNTPCRDNSVCPATSCSRCDAFSATCVLGGPCGAPCSIASDCNQMGSCVFCTSGVCSDHLLASPGPGVGQVQCAATCATSSDCNPSGPCATCADFSCTATCGQKCVHTTDCNGPANGGCSVCTGGLCGRGAVCGSRCSYDRDCNASSSCGKCRQGICERVTCGALCKDATDCGGKCGVCDPGNGTCVAAVCGTTCARNIDCLFTGSCTSCTAGTCTPPMCGSECERPSHCPPGNCSSCFNGQCALPTCGAVCFGDGDCSAPWPGSRYCGYCLDNRCSTSAPSAQCGLNTPCTPGDNSVCPATSCSRCDAFSATCVLGGPCGAPCSIATDCNQMGSCVFCASGICMTQPDSISAAEYSQMQEEQKRRSGKEIV